MTPSDLPLPATHRPEFFAGEVLHAAELADVIVVERSLRWLHNRVLHGWGVGLGLTVDGARGAKSISVSEGYAVDAAGRDLVLEQTVTLPVPPVAAGPDGGPVDYVLVVAYTEDDAAPVDLRDGACDTVGAVRRHDDPTVAWRIPAAVRDGLDVVLAAASVRGCALTAAPTTAAVRRRLGSIPTPRVAAGTADPTWSLWPSESNPAGVTATVDTSLGGFGDTPAYQVSIVGRRRLPGNGVPFVIDGNPHVERAGMLSFDVVVPMPEGTLTGGNGGAMRVNPPDVGRFDNFVNGSWKVEWIGVETT
jgi:hypothetical protein